MAKQVYQVKIIKCSHKCFWYKDQIGQVFNCKEDEETVNPLVHTVNDVVRPEGGWRHILPTDCEEILPEIDIANFEDGSEDPVTDTDRDEDERTDRDFPGYT